MVLKDADHLSKLGFTFPIKMKDPKKFNVEEGLVEVTHAPTGCMLIKRGVIEKMIKAHPELEIYQPTFINGKETKKPNMYNLFECLHDPKKLKDTLEKTLVSVKDGQKWAVRLIYMS